MNNFLNSDGQYIASKMYLAPWDDTVPEAIKQPVKNKKRYKIKIKNISTSSFLSQTDNLLTSLIRKA